MKRFVSKNLKRLAGEDGFLSFEYSIWVPAMVLVMCASIELGVIAIRGTMLERSLDLTVRDLRLGTTEVPDYYELKQQICERAAILPSCSTNLRLEMIRIDPRAWNFPPDAASCSDQPEDVDPVRQWDASTDENQLMFIRACILYTPIFPSGLIASHLPRINGKAALVSASAYVTEPR